MKTLLTIAVIVLVTSELSCKCKGRGGYIEAIEICNLYIDSVLSNITNKYGDVLDPFYSHNNTFNFNKKVLFIDFEGEAELTNGSIEGITELRRVSPCSLSLEDGRFILSAHLQSSELLFNFQGLVEFMKMNSPVTITGNSSGADVTFSFTLNATTGGAIRLDKLKVWRLRDLRISVGGMRSFMRTWWTKTLNDILVDHSKEFFKHATSELVSLVMGSYVLEDITRNPFVIDNFEIDKEDISTNNEGPTLSPDEDDDSANGRPKFSKEDAAHYIDILLDNRFRQEANYAKLDPYTLPDNQIESAFMPNPEVNNKLDLKNGYLENLSKAKRISDCTRPVRRLANVTFSCYIGFDRLDMKYETGDNSAELELIGKITNTILAVKITANQDNVPILKEIAINNIGKVSVKAAYVIADSLYQSVPAFNQDRIVASFSNTLVDVLNGRFKDVLAYSIFKTPFQFLDNRK